MGNENITQEHNWKPKASLGLITTAVMLAATKAETAIQLTTQITTRAVNAYKEIMQMNI